LTRCGGGGRAVGGEEAGVVGLKRGERISRMRIEKLVSSFWGRDEVLLEGLQWHLLLNLEMREEMRKLPEIVLTCKIWRKVSYGGEKLTRE
jgi:hypothetical protein